MRSATVERALEWIKNRGSVQVNDGLAGITLPYRPPAWRPEATYCSVGSPLVRFLARSIAVFAEFERAMIVERVNSGLARANARRSISRKPIARLSVRGASADSTAL